MVLANRCGTLVRRIAMLGGSVAVPISPNGQNVWPLVADNAGDYHLRVRQDTQATVAGPVLGTVTDRISPPAG